MQAIFTKLLSPTKNGKGIPQRISARSDSGRLMYRWDFTKNEQENHDAAAMALAQKLGWAGKWARGSVPQSFGEKVNCYVALTQLSNKGKEIQVNSVIEFVKEEES